MKKTIGILAHVDAGKTTFSEQLLFHANAIRTAGRVDHKNTFLDSDEIEKERGITIFSEQAVFEYGSDTYYLVDTPGHVDFSAEMERSVRILDYAVLIISCVEGIQSHTDTLWRILRDADIPVVFFLNKTDREGANPDFVLKQIQEKLTGQAVCFDGFCGGDMEESLQEEIAQLDEALLTTYIEEGFVRQKFIDAICSMVNARSLFPVMTGSALNDYGIQAFLDTLHIITKTASGHTEDPFRALVYKVRYEGKQRVSFLKILSGTLHVKDSVILKDSVTDENIQEKVNEIRQYNGNKSYPLQTVYKGDLCGVTGLANTHSGAYIGDKSGYIPYISVPALSVRVLFDEHIYSKTVLEYFKILEDEDPLLKTVYHKALNQIQVHIMGMVQLEILKEIVQKRFGLRIAFAAPEILYRETIKQRVIGSGHFEPLRHYAEVHLMLSPAKRGSGVRFESICHVDELSASYQNLIKTHVLEKQHKGVCLGMPIDDINITLLTGRAHLKHTEGGDFREAVYRAVRHGLFFAESVILEPYYTFKIEVYTDDMGKIISDIQRLFGEFDTPQIVDATAILTGRAPVSEFMNYAAEFTNTTRGTGYISLAFGGYDVCHNEREVIEKIGYDRERDRENTADSVFCSHGAGFLVKWDKAAEYMHCSVEKFQ